MGSFTLNNRVKIDENKLFAKTRHNPSIITDFKCKNLVCY